MMTDLAYSLHSSRKTKNLQMFLPKQRMQSAPTIKAYTPTPEEDAPQSQLSHAININYDYLSTPFVQNVKSIEKLNNLVTSYFAQETIDASASSASPYSSSEWMSILRDRNTDPAEKERIQSSLRDGLPCELRRKIWLYLAKTEKNKKDYLEKGITYEGLKKQQCTQEDKIKQDIGRSSTEDDFYQSNVQEKFNSIFQILRAYANFDPEVGYTQGMNFIVAVMLSFVQGEYSKGSDSQSNNEDPANRLETTEEEVFWILVYIMQEKEWRKLFLPSIPKLKTLLESLNTRVKEALPELYAIVQKYNCLSLCFVQYFLTIMIYKSPPDLAKRILEIFLIEGEEILLHVIVKALALCEKEIRDKEDSDELFPFLKDHLFEFISK